MQKSLIFLTIGALGAIISLYSLPKGILRDESKSLTKSANRDTEASVKDDGPHQGLMNTVQNEDYNRLVNKLGRASSSAEKKTYADSLGIFFYKLNRPDSAAGYFGIVADFNPGLKTWKKAGDVYYEAFRLALDSERGNKYGENARSFYEKVLQAKPDELEVKSKMAMTYVTTSNPMQGIALLREVVAKDPDNVTALTNLGLLAMQSRQYDKAIDRFEKILGKHKDNSEARLYLAVSYAEAGKNEEALKEFNFLKLNEKDAVILQTVDRYLQKLNQ